MTEIQQIERNMLAVFVDICRELGLRYYLVCGSALGAVKYGGFIPWDDDIDVAMPRPDYERFLEKAPARLPEHLFLQNYRTDPEFPHIYSKLRHCGTTCIEENTRHLAIHQGIFLDIFPLDGYPKGKLAQLGLELGKKWYQHLLNTAFAPPENRRSLAEYRVKRLLGFHRHTAVFAARLEGLLTNFPTETAEVWCNHGNWQGTADRGPKDWFGAGTEGTFEGLTVTLPTDWDAYLTRKYGDYRREPPRNQQKSHHNFAILDPERPYTDYLGRDGL